MYTIIRYNKLTTIITDITIKEQKLPGCKHTHGLVLIDLMDEIVAIEQPSHHDQTPKTYTIPYKATIFLWHIA
jgi:hypothetical protein